jgi:hypothetical protein
VPGAAPTAPPASFALAMLAPGTFIARNAYPVEVIA